MGEVRQEIATAIKGLKYTNEQITLLDFDSGKKIYFKLLSSFVSSGDRRWWWEDFKVKPFEFVDHEKPFEKLNEIVPNSAEKVWLMVEDEQEEYYPIYDCEASIIGRVISECYGFEYYIIDKGMNWLICENHHNTLIGLGQILKEKNLDKIKSRTKPDS